MKLLRILFLAFCLMTTIVVRAYDFEADGLYYDLVSTGDLTCALVDGPSPYTGNLIIPDEVEYSGKKLKVVKIECKLPEVSSVKFGKNITYIVFNCFLRNELLTSVEWTGDMVLNESIFRECVNLKNLTYKSICKSIPMSAFEKCTSLTSIDLSSVESISNEAFMGCKSLKMIDLSSIKALSGDSFHECGDIKSVIIGPNLEYISSGISLLSFYFPFNGCNIDSLSILPGKTPLKLQATEQQRFKFDYQVKSLYLGREMFLIKDGKRYSPFEKVIPFVATHKDSLDLKYVRIGESVTELLDSYFSECNNLSNIVFDGNNIKIGDYCFRETNLKNITLPTGSNEIGKEAFPPCVEFISFGSKVSLPSNGLINDIEASALKQISILSVEPPKGSSFTNQIYTTATLLVPYGTKEAYSNSATWRNFWNIEEMPGVNTEKVEVSPVNAEMHIGDTIRLTGTKYPENSMDTIQWKSSDVKIATVSDKGIVTAIAPGKATITAVSGKVSATCEVTVLPIAAEKIELNKDNVSLNQSDTIRITATISPETVTDKTIKWTSSDEKVATVSDDGIVTAIGAGTATITATCGDVSAACEVTIHEPNIDIDFTDNTLAIAVEGSDSTIGVSVFTALGQRVYKQSLEASSVVKKEIDLSKLTSGTYIVQIVSGDMNASKIIVKQ